MTHTKSNVACLNSNILLFNSFHINFWYSLNRNHIEFNYYIGYNAKYQGVLEEAIASVIDHTSVSTRRSNSYIYIDVTYTYKNALELDAALKELASYIGLSLA